MVAMPGQEAHATRRLRIALASGAALWLFLLVAGFFAPGGWHWGWPESIGHMINYMIALWFVTLVLAPLLAMRAPLHNTAVIQLYFLGILGILVSSLRAERPEPAPDGVPLIVALYSVGIVLWAHPHRAQLWRLFATGS